MTEVFKAPLLGDSKPTELSSNVPDTEQVGVGMRIETREGRFFVSFLLGDTPAAQAGIKVGDEILDIEGSPVTNLSYEEVSAKLRGSRGSLLNLVVQHPQESEPRLISVVRDKSQTQSITQKKSVHDLLFSPSGSKPTTQNLSAYLKPNPKPFLGQGSLNQIKKKTQKILNILKEKEVVSTPTLQKTVLPSDSLESRLSGLQEESLKEAEKAEELPENNQGFLKRETKRLKKASQRLKQKTSRIVQAIFERSEEKQAVASKPASTAPQAPSTPPAMMKIFYDENAGKVPKSQLSPLPMAKKKKPSELKPATPKKMGPSVRISFADIDKKLVLKISFLVLLLVAFYFSLPKTPKQRPFIKRSIKVVPTTPQNTSETEKKSESGGD